MKKQFGFSLLELAIAMFILVLLISIAVPTYQYMVQKARETVLKENLFQIRKAIDQFVADKGRLPESLDELVEKKYLREKPIDPITEQAEWEEVFGPDPNSPEGRQGLINVKSLAEGEDETGKKYRDY